MKLFVGLGNPGQKYAGNRHNVGFMALDRIAESGGLPAWRKRFHGLATDGLLGTQRVLLLKPQSYYNESGRSVREAAKFLKIKAADIVVFHDEIDLAPGKLRVKLGGGLAGNNGLRSISAQLGGPDFVRVRIGVGHPGDKNQVANYVLRDFPKADRGWLEIVLDAIAGSAERLAADETERFQTDVAQAMNAFRDGRRDDGAEADKGSATRTASREAASGSPQKQRSRSGAKTAASPASQAKAKRGGPSQLELARQASASKRKKPSRRIKKGAPSGEGATADGSQIKDSDREGDGAGIKTALAERLRRWLGGSGNNT